MSRIALAFLLVTAGAEARTLSIVLGPVDMRSASEGLAVRTFDDLVRDVAWTRDGGRSWTRLSDLGPLGLRGARAASALDGRTMLIAGDGWVLRTIDGGARWRRVEVPSELSYRKIAFAGASSSGWILGARGPDWIEATLLTTLDSGRTFRIRNPGLRLRDFAFTEPLRGYGVDGRGILQSRDGGASFTRLPPLRGAYTAVAARGRLLLAAGPGPGRLSRSQDGGASFAVVALPTDVRITRVAILNDSASVAADDGGRTFRSEDAGRTFRGLPNPPSPGTVRHVDSGLAYADGAEVLFLSTDRGQTWAPADPSYSLEIPTEVAGVGSAADVLPPSPEERLGVPRDALERARRAVDALERRAQHRRRPRD